MIKPLLTLGLMLLATTAMANEPLYLGEQFATASRTLPQPSLQLAANDLAGESGRSNTAAAPGHARRLFTRNTLHKYLGLGSLLAAGLTMVAPKPDEEGAGPVDLNGPHRDLARTAAALGGAAVLTGLLFHYDDLSLSGGITDPDNQHALLTTLGALGYAGAVAAAPGEGHIALGIGGGASMLLGIKLEW